MRFRRCDKCGNTWTTVESVKPNDEYLENFILVAKSRSEHFCKSKDKA
nr:MAG TPA: RNA polymerase I-like protein [Caudoviricetes sp.]